MFQNSRYFNKIFYFLSVLLLVFLVANPVLAFIELVTLDEFGNPPITDYEDDSYGADVFSKISVSLDGRYVAFVSQASLVSSDTNGSLDIYIRDRQNDSVERVSVDSLGNEGNSFSYIPSISGDGRYISFYSVSSNLVAGDTNGFGDVFVHDRQTGVTERVSVDSFGNEVNNTNSIMYPEISENGRYVTFASRATNLVSGDTNGVEDVFVHDRQTGVTERVSVDSLGNEGNSFSYIPSISGDGRYISFYSVSSNLVAGDTNGFGDVFVHDRQTGVTERVSVDSLGNESDGDSYGGDISSDGRYISFYSESSNLVSGDTNGVEDVFVHDRQTGVTERVSVDSLGNEGNGFSFRPSISGDGRYVSFETQSLLSVDDENTTRDVYVRDTIDNVTYLISRNILEAHQENPSYSSSISGDGRYVVFYSWTNLDTRYSYGNTFQLAYIFDFNDPPTNVTLDPSSLYENLPIGTVVGELSATDPNTGDVLTYSLTCDSPEGGDTFFEIVGNEVRTLNIFDYEDQPLYDICVRVSDGNGGETQEALTIFILYAVPTDINLSNNSINENNSVGANIGTLSTVISETGSTFMYSFSCVTPGADDSSFSISGDSLDTLVSFDYETKTTYEICIFSEDQDTGESLDKNFTINVLDVNEGGGGGSSGSNPNQVNGCTDSDATNYNPNAVIDNGSCIYTPGSVPGCTDVSATNYNPLANVFNNTCVYGAISGCTDLNALNFNSSATVNDGSCEYPPGINPPPDNGGDDDPKGCTDLNALNFSSSAIEDDGSCLYGSPDDIIGCTDSSATNYNPLATVNSNDCEYINPPPGGNPPNPIKEVVDIIENIPSGIKNSIPVSGVVVPSLLVWFLQPGLFAGIFSSILRIFNLIPFLMGYKRERRPWGTVYDSVTKQPLDPVYVSLKTEDGQEISSSITDMNGRYGFLAQSGLYKIFANKDNYIFPSAKMSGKTSDELYDNLYFGENLEVKEKEDVVFKNIPMDAINFNWNEFEKSQNKKLMKFYSKRDLLIARFANILFVFGLASSIIIFFIDNSLLNTIVLSLYGIILLLRIFGIKPKQAGYVFDKSGFPLSFAILRLYSSALDREVSHTVVGKTGKYYMLVKDGQYYIKLFKKTGEDSYEEVYKSSDMNIKNGFLKKKIRL